MKNKKILLSFLILTILISLSQAQPRYRASLSAANEPGFYAIDLPTDITGKSAPLLTDIRVTDQAGKEIAYFIRKDAYTKEANEFIAYPFHFLPSSGDRKTKVIIETGGEQISSLTLNMKNSDAHKTGTLEGSNDQDEWFGVREKIVLPANYSQHEPETYTTFDLPLSDYLYYKLTIDDSMSAPLNIAGIGQVRSKYESYRHMVEVTVQKTVNRDSAGITSITLDYGAKQPIRNLRIYIGAPAFYKRNLYIEGEAGYHTLNSDDSSSLWIHYNQHTDRTTLHIQNNDDRPLRIDSVKVYADKLFLITYLPEAGNYFLTYGDSTARKPDYDLMFFADKIPEAPQKLTILSTETIVAVPAADHTNGLFLFLKKYGIWTIIVIVSAQILYSVWKMSKK